MLARVVVHAYNPKYSGSRGRLLSSRPAWTKAARLYSKAKYKI
jgi:hypothetical protein